MAARGEVVSWMTVERQVETNPAVRTAQEVVILIEDDRSAALWALMLDLVRRGVAQLNFSPHWLQ